MGDIAQIVGGFYVLMGTLMMLVAPQYLGKDIHPIRRGIWLLLIGFALQLIGMVWNAWEVILSGGLRPLIIAAALSLPAIRLAYVALKSQNADPTPGAAP